MRSKDLVGDVPVEDVETEDSVQSNADDYDLKKEVKERSSSFIKEHVVIIAACFVGLIMCIIGLNIGGSAKAEYTAVFNNLNDVNNRIKQDTIDITQKPEYKATGVVGGLDKERWASDDTIITEWIYPAFNFENANEYNEHREIYVTRLGTADDFVMEVLPPYIPGYTEVTSEATTIDDGSNINMKMTNFKSYVDGFKDDLYSYVAVVSCSSTRPSGQTVTSDMILTYSINGKGQVVNFHAATPYVTYNT